MSIENIEKNHISGLSFTVTPEKVVASRYFSGHSRFLSEPIDIELVGLVMLEGQSPPLRILSSSYVATENGLKKVDRVDEVDVSSLYQISLIRPCVDKDYAGSNRSYFRENEYNPAFPLAKCTIFHPGSTTKLFGKFSLGNPELPEESIDFIDTFLNEEGEEVDLLVPEDYDLISSLKFQFQHSLKI